MDNQKNLRPFSFLGIGDLFSPPSHPSVMLMKTEGSRAVVLQEYSLFSRGALLPFLHSDDVIPQPKGLLII